MASFRLLAMTLTLFALTACNGPKSLTLHDTEGRVFSARCAAEMSSCVLQQKQGPHGAGAPVLRANGRYIGVCDSAHDADCRLLTCTGDDDCPAAGRAPHGSCVGGLCTDPTHEITSSDSVMSCLAGTGVGHAEARQVERYALGLNCGTPCVIPKPCERR